MTINPGVGATLDVSPPRDAAAPSPSAAPAPLLEGGNERILLVEDELIVRELAAEMLRAQHYDVLVAADPLEALGVADGERIDALVTDVVMPHMSGRVLAARLRERRPALPILYISGYSDDAALRDGELEEGAAFLQKPFGARDLGRVVGQILATATQS